MPWQRLLLLCLLLGAQLHCFELREIIRFEKDGSGRFSFRIGLQEKYRAMLNLRKNQEGSDAQSPLNPGQSYQIPFESIQKIPGITDVRLKKDDQSAFTEVSFHFASVEALNAAYNQIFQHSQGQAVFRLTRNHFERFQVDLPSGQIPAEIPGLEILHVTEYYFPYKVRKASNKRTILAEDERSITLTASLLSREERRLDNLVQFRRFYHCWF
ncbi:MAG: hypothetical protein HS115_19300 [Spirochaetales bacterium]|nr:hypothetical protein [Spirochaetales bacterium]